MSSPYIQHRPVSQSKCNQIVTRLNSTFTLLDGYGESYKSDPIFGAKSTIGGMIWLAFKLLMVALFIVNVYKLFTTAYFERFGRLLSCLFR